MIALIAAAISLQSAVRIERAWTLDRAIEIEGVPIGVGNLTRMGSSSQFVTLLPGPVDQLLKNGFQYFCKLDAASGKMTPITQLSWTRGGTHDEPDNTTYSIAPNGELLKEHLKGKVETLAVMNPENRNVLYTLREGTNGCLEPEDDGVATKATLFPARYRFKIVGEVTVLSDGPNARIAMSGYEVNSYYPGSWDIKSPLLKKGDLMSKARPFLDLQVKGDPQSGTFTLSNSFSHAFFHNGMRIADIRETLEPMDAGPNGFLVIERPAGAPRRYVCLDAETGEQLWTFQERSIGTRYLRWVGNYAVTLTGNLIEQSGKLVCKLIVLDAKTGKKAGELLLPSGVDLWEKSGLDDVVILADLQDKYYGYRIVPKS